MLEERAGQIASKIAWTSRILAFLQADKRLCVLSLTRTAKGENDLFLTPLALSLRAGYGEIAASFASASPRKGMSSN
jgi:hypothetical protein